MYNSRHGSVLLGSHNIIKSKQRFKFFDDIEVYLNSSMIAGRNPWLGVDFDKRDFMLLLELTVRF